MRASLGLLSPSLGSGQIKMENGALSWLAVYGDRAPMVLHDAVDNREPESGALPLWLGGEERFKDVFHCSRGHAASVVGDRQPDVGTFLEFGAGAGKVGTYHDGFQPHIEYAAVLHSIGGIGSQIHQDLVHLRRVCRYGGHIGAEVSANFDLRRQARPQQLQDLLDNRREFDDFAFRFLLPTEGKNLANQLRGSRAGLLDLRQILLNGMVRGQVS